MYFEQHIRILEWCLKDYVTGVMMQKKSALKSGIAQSCDVHPHKQQDLFRNATELRKSIFMQMSDDSMQRLPIVVKTVENTWSDGQLVNSISEIRLSVIKTVDSANRNVQKCILFLKGSLFL